VKQAQERLEKALTRLEATVGDKLSKSGEADAELVRDLQTARQELAGYKEKNQAVSDRLDAAIDRMRTALGE
jgi:uncharacterized heparinase superfamily protein